jgi:hypothetical protein
MTDLPPRLTCMSFTLYVWYFHAGHSTWIDKFISLNISHMFVVFYMDILPGNSNWIHCIPLVSGVVPHAVMAGHFIWTIYHHFIPLFPGVVPHAVTV